MGDATPTGRFEASFYFDLDRDGQRDPGEPGAFAFIHAFDQNTWKTVADLYGSRLSVELPTGTYMLRFGNVDFDLSFGPFDVSGGKSTILERGFLPGRIDIVTFLDADGDGVFDSGEEHPYGLKPYLWHQYHAPGSVSYLDGPAFSFVPLLPGPYTVFRHPDPHGFEYAARWEIDLAEGEAVTITVPMPIPKVSEITVLENSSTWVGTDRYWRGDAYVTGPFLSPENS